MTASNIPLALVRGGGDLASGVVLRLHRAGIRVVIAELPQPLAVRRTVSFAEAVYEGTQTVEGVTARLVELKGITAAIEAGEVPVVVDPDAEILQSGLTIPAVIDARLIKQAPQPLAIRPALHIGLGPGFEAGRDCDAVVETQRGHTLGRVYWTGTTMADSGVPEGDPRRVLRAPVDGVLAAEVNIGDHLQEGQRIGAVREQEGGEAPVISPLAGILRGLIRDGIPLTRGVKLGDVDPRGDPRFCFLVSDKALAIGGGVLEAMLARAEIRSTFLGSQAAARL